MNERIDYIEKLHKTAVTDVRINALKDRMTLKITTYLQSSPGTFGIIDSDEAKLREWIRMFETVEKEYPQILFTRENDAPLTKEELELKAGLIGRR